MEEFLQKLSSITEVKKYEPMARHTTFKIGGPAKYFVEADSVKTVKEALMAAREYSVKSYVIGNGSNLLVSDFGIDGLVIMMGNKFSEVRADGECIYAEAGAKLSKIAKCALAHSLTGFEFAAGIPGSIGGAVYMNAGAYGGEMSNIIAESTAIDEDFSEITVTEHDFGYRKSIYKDSGKVITGAKIRLTTGDGENIRETMESLAARRREKQPLELPSAGSVFKRPEGFYAGALIEGAGLKGETVGGAMVSDKHAGFIVNKGGATAEDVKKLIEIIKTRVYEKYRVLLDTEIKFI